MAFGVRARVIPGFGAPVAGFDDADEVQQFAASQRVGDDMAARAHPVDADGCPQRRRQTRHRHDAAPGHQPGVGRATGAEGCLPQGRMHAIGSQRGVASKAAPIGAVQGNPIALFFERLCARSQAHGIGLERAHGRQQDPVQVAPMQHPVRRAETCQRIGAQVEQGPGAAAVPHPHLLARGRAGHRLDRGAQAQRLQHARAVRRDLHTGADLLQRSRLLQHRHGDAALQQGQRGGEAAQPGTGDQDVGRRWHGDVTCDGLFVSMLTVAVMMPCAARETTKATRARIRRVALRVMPGAFL